jgi:hypothetical protein
MPALEDDPGSPEGDFVPCTDFVDEDDSTRQVTVSPIFVYPMIPHWLRQSRSLMKYLDVPDTCDAMVTMFRTGGNHDDDDEDDPPHAEGDQAWTCHRLSPTSDTLQLTQSSHAFFTTLFALVTRMTHRSPVTLRSARLVANDLTKKRRSLKGSQKKQRYCHLEDSIQELLFLRD